MIKNFFYLMRILPYNFAAANKMASAWQTNPQFAVTLLVLIIASMAFMAVLTVLIIYHLKNKNSEKNKNLNENAAAKNLQSLLDIMPIALRITEKDTAKVIYANNACLKMFEYKNSEDLYGISLYNLIPEIQNDGSCSNDKINSLLNNDDFACKEVDYIIASGKTFCARVEVSNIIYSGVNAKLAIITDLAAEKESEKVRKNLQTVLDMLPVAVRVIDNNTKLLTYANKAAAQMFGMSSETALGSKSLDFLPEKQPNGMLSADLLKIAFLADTPITREVTLCKKTGETFVALITSVLIDYNGVESSLGMIVDLTAEKEYQKMLANTAKKEKEANTLKSRFLVNMSHEIRTPMNAIIGLTEIELHNDFEPNKDIYRKINISAKNLLTLINDILDMSKIEEDKIELNEEEFELEEVLSNSILITAPRLSGKNVEIMLNGAPDLPRYVVGDRTRLWQILKNLLDNSTKFTDNGKITVTAAADYDRSDDKTVTIKFAVRDTGIGMDSKEVDRIFLPYQQVRNFAQKKYSGTGLGMPISRQLCRLMGGELTVESELGKGTTVNVVIPFRRSASAEAKTWIRNIPELSGIKILAADDDKSTLDIIEGILVNSGAKCVSVQSGKEAVALALQQHERGEPFDIILLDHVMDGISGLETARIINDTLPDTPKLLMATAHQRHFIKDEIENSHISCVVEKPFVPLQLLGRLCNALGCKYENDKKTQEEFVKFKDVRILLCEDYHLNQEVAADMLAQFGIPTTVAENGRDGIELLKSGKTFDLIFMDIHMPVMDGYEASRIIRSDSRYDGIPIIALTADVMKKAMEKCLKIGMNDHLTKPIEYDTLYKILLKWLPESKRAGDVTFKLADDAGSDALTRFGGDKKRYTEALLEFSELLPDEWPDFNTALAESEKTQQYIHKLKGSSGTLSENEIFRLASEAEAALRDEEFSETVYNRLIKACANVKKRILSQYGKTATAVRTNGTRSELIQLLTSLKKALEEYDPDVIDPIIELLQSKAWPQTEEQELRKLYALTNKFDYASALTVLVEIIDLFTDN